MHSKIKFILFFFERHNRLNQNEIFEHWTQYIESQFVFKLYHLNELLKVAAEDKMNRKYFKLSELWDRCSVGRTILLLFTLKNPEYSRNASF